MSKNSSSLKASEISGGFIIGNSFDTVGCKSIIYRTWLHALFCFLRGNLLLSVFIMAKTKKVKLPDGYFWKMAQHDYQNP